MGADTGKPDETVTAAELLESLDRHFLAGCPSLSTGQLREHKATGTCPECRERAGDTAEAERRNAEYEQYAYGQPGIRL
jgi:hypothetical protein